MSEMDSELVDLAHLTVPSPEDLTSVPLVVGILGNKPDMAFGFSGLLAHLTKWHFYPFESIEHAETVLTNVRLNVFIAYWHSGCDHDFDNRVTRLVNHLKAARTSRSDLSAGPLVIGLYGWNPDYVNSEFLGFLDATYDVTVEIPIDLKVLIAAVTVQLWLRLP